MSISFKVKSWLRVLRKRHYWERQEEQNLITFWERMRNEQYDQITKL